MEVYGYKCFYNGLMSQYGTKLELGKTYEIDGPIKYGNRGFHMSEYMEDTLRYFDAMNKEIVVCYVKGSGDIIYRHDEYNDTYDSCVSKIEILKVLTREDIINLVLNIANEFRVITFISQFKLTEDEINRFKEKFKNTKMVLDMIDYYQYKNYCIDEEGVKVYGQYSNKRR